MKDLIRAYFPGLAENQLQQLKAFGESILDWNQKINLVSRKDTDHLWTKHILHSMSIAKVLHFSKGSQILDVGTGGGFPGIPLAILFPETTFHLIDSRGKKIMVVSDIIEKLELKNVTAEKIRAEEIKGRFDFITARAVTNMPDFIQWIKKNVSNKNKNSLANGIIYLKGGDITLELTGITNPQIFTISDFFLNPISIKNTLSISPSINKFD
jgi:16S rRNA (guanine527-N7)-methyltransferase